MSEDEEEHKPQKKVVDVNIHVDKQGKKTEVTDKDAQALAEQLSLITGTTVEPAKFISEYEEQKRRLHTELAEEIGSRRSERSRREGLEKAHRTVYPTSSGQARLSGGQATGDDFQGVTGDLKRMEFDSYSDMIQTLRELSSQGDAEASRYLQKLYRKAIKGSARQHVSAEYHGKITKLLREPRREGDAEKEAEIEEEIEAEKSKWKEESD